MAHTLIISIFFFVFLFIPISALAQGDGRVAAGSTLTADGRSSPWLSPSGEFAFGFKPVQDKDEFLLSIWYHNIPEKTVAWYLKSMINPVPGGSTIRVDSGTGLVLLDPKSQSLWKTEGIEGQTDHAFLNDTGNFILLGSDGSWLWESFRHYADTMLPSQELNIGSVLNSRRSETDFSNGKFYLRFLEGGNLALTSKSVAENSLEDAVYYQKQTADPGSRVIFDSRGFLYILKSNGERESLSPVSGPPGSEYYHRATLDFDGVFASYFHPKNLSGNPNPGWKVFFSLPENICAADIISGEGSGACGYNNICNLQDKRPVCECPTGYSLVDPNDKYGNCRPDFTLTCEDHEFEQRSAAADQQYDFVVRTDIDWPTSDYERIYPTTNAICRQSCLHDCFCTVAIFRSNSCWKKKLPLSNGKVDNSLDSIAFIKYRKSTDAPDPSPKPPRFQKKESKPKERGTLILVGSVLLGSSLLVNLTLAGTICSSVYLVYRKKKVNLRHSRTAALESNLRCFTFKELTEATNEFKEELGRGAFGVVYKGELALMSSGNISVAVKKLDRVVQEAPDREFFAEVNSIGKTNHKNLVRLLGFCDEGQHRLLVYEYIRNGALASFIFSDDDAKPSWKIRKQIAVGIARGLVYLHEECSTQIIHCDIKPQNILLDEYYNARISDFGLAKLLDINQSKASLTNVRGTKGYVAPEWFRNNQITAKVDVYSFGVLLLEIISCRNCVKEIKIDEEDCGLLLTDFVWDCFQGRRLNIFVGNDLEALSDEMMLERFVMVSIWCVQEISSLRPTMRKVSQMLEGIMEVKNPPNPYPFSSTS